MNTEVCVLCQILISIIFHKQTTSTLKTFYAELAEQVSDVTKDRGRGENGGRKEVRSDK